MEDSKTTVVSQGETCDKVFLFREDGQSLPFSHIILETGAKLDLTLVIFPGVSCDIPLYVDMKGIHSEVNLSGIYVCPGRENVKIGIELHHRVPCCRSSQLFKGIAGGSSRVDFHGRITVAKDAQKTEAYQADHNIILSDSARINTKPQLEIYADDVKCSHGATIGRLNEDEQFYMCSRGIPAKEAKILQMISFLSPVLGNIRDLSEREAILSDMEESIRRMDI